MITVTTFSVQLWTYASLKMIPCSYYVGAFSYRRFAVITALFTSQARRSLRNCTLLVMRGVTFYCFYLFKFLQFSVYRYFLQHEAGEYIIVISPTHLQATFASLYHSKTTSDVTGILTKPNIPVCINLIEGFLPLAKGCEIFSNSPSFD